MTAMMNSRMTQTYSAIVLMLLVAAAWFYLVRPVESRIAAAEADAAAKQQAYDVIQVSRDGLDKQADARLVALEAAMRTIPPAPAEDALIRDLRRLEVVSGLQLTMFNLTVGTEPVGAADGGAENGVPVYPVRIETGFAGTYDQIAALLAESETLERLVRVTSLSLGASQQTHVQINAAGQPVAGSLVLTAWYAPGAAGPVKAPVLDYTEPAGRTTPFY